MIHHVTEAKYLEDYRIWLRFDDQRTGVVDLSQIIRFDGIFEPLRDTARFAEVFLNTEVGTICWPNGADLAPEVLYQSISSSDSMTA